MSHIVVTGARGLIGSHLVKELGQSEHVHAIVRQPIVGSKPPNVHEHILDFSAHWSSDALPAQVDAVIHLAQSQHFREFPEMAEDVFHVNVQSTLRLLDYARRSGAKTFVLASSGGVYGYGDQGFTEDKEIASHGNLGFYLGTKLCSEIIAETFASYMNVIMLRFFFVYGAGQRHTMLIPRLVRSVAAGKPITLQGNDGIRINPTYISDAVNAIRSALTLEGSHKINVGGPDVLSLRQIGEIIGEEINKEPCFEQEKDSVPRHLIGDIKKMSHLLQPPRITFVQGIQRLLATEKFG